MRSAFIRTHKPVMDDADFRGFDTTADYRRWCEEHLERFEDAWRRRVVV